MTFITCSLLVISCTKEIEVSALEPKDGIFYLKGESEPFTGKAVNKTEEGKLVFESSYKNGKPDGVTKGWNNHGALTFEGHYKDGKENGKFSSYSINGI